MDRDELERLWHSRLDDARLRYEFARIYTNEVQRDLPTLSTADGALALQRAQRAENVALAENKRVLRVYAELVMDGKVPDQGDWHKAAGA